MEKHCKKCLLPDTFPGLTLDENDVCNLCNNFENEIARKSSNLFENEEELAKFLKKFKKRGNKYDVLVPLSGGVDSSNALVTIVEKYNLRPLVYHNDDGFVIKIASENARKLCAGLDVDLVVWQHDMNFMNKLFRYINESDLKISTCLMCGTILYLNNIELARKFNIPLIINGFSKGGFSIITNRPRFNSMVEQIIAEVLKREDIQFVREFRNKFKLMDEHVILQELEDAEESIRSDLPLFIPYYMFKFNKTDKEAYKESLMRRFDWQPMPTSYPCRTTNCIMIWLNTYSDFRKMDYTYFTEEYAYMMREGEFSQEQAKKDLMFSPPPGMLKELAKKIGQDAFECPDSVTLDNWGKPCK